LTPARDAIDLDVCGRHVRLSRPGKVLFPAAGFTKRDLVDYYLAAAPLILPHVAGRAVTLARFPDGVGASWWFQTNCPRGQPEWLRVAELRGTRGQRLRYCRIEEPAALAWAANLGAIELHPLLATVERPDAPLSVVFDLDPGPDIGMVACCRVAIAIRLLLARLGLKAVPKTSGSAGLHVLVPLDGSESFHRTHAFARAVAERLEADAPELVTSRLARAGREARVLVDWRQNSAGLSTVAPYSLRGRAWPRVSAPVTWSEIERAAETGSAGHLDVGPADALARAGRQGDLFGEALTCRQRLGARLLACSLVMSAQGGPAGGETSPGASLLSWARKPT